MAINNGNGDQGNRSDDRAEVDAILVEIDFPATGEDLVEAARDADVADTVIVMLQSLPGDEEYTSSDDVNKALDRTSGNRR